MIGGPEVLTRDLRLFDAAEVSNRPSQLVEAVPSWMPHGTTVRFGEHHISLDESALPPLGGIMGAMHMLRSGSVEPNVPHAQVRYGSGSESNQPSGFGKMLSFGPELAAVGAAAASALFSRKGEKTKNAVRTFALVESSGRLIACGSPVATPAAIETEVPQEAQTEAPATEPSVQITVTPLSNDVESGTPSAPPETPSPIQGASYPTEVSALQSPLVYSYGGEAGRQNMNEYTRQLFDRYIAEMGRGGLIVGGSVDELYRAFDQNYDFKLFTTEEGLTWLIQSKTDGSFLIPKDEDGQIFRDLQLPYDYLFQSGTAIEVGIDNFAFQRFQANKVGFVGAWPVLVSVDAQGLPISWINMEQGGAANPITVASAIETPVQEATAIPDSRIALTVGEETFRVTTDVLYSEAVTNVNIDPTKAQKIGEVLVYTDAEGRLLWNEHLQAWVPEFRTNMDYAHPELSPSVPIEAYYDGSKPGDTEYIPSSSTLSDMVYVTENPGLIASDATHPYYRVALATDETGPNGYYITLTGPNQYLLTEQNTTQISRNENKPFVYFGMQQTKDARGNIIYVVKRASWNPTSENPSGIITMNMGFDKERYEAKMQFPLLFKFLDVQAHPPGELLPVFPYEYKSYRFSADTFSYSTDKPSPNVAALLDTDMISMFEPAEQQNIKNLIKGYNVAFDAKTNPGSYLLSSLPPELSNMILFTGMQSWQ